MYLAQKKHRHRYRGVIKMNSLKVSANALVSYWTMERRSDVTVVTNDSKIFVFSVDFKQNGTFNC